MTQNSQDLEARLAGYSDKSQGCVEIARELFGQKADTETLLRWANRAVEFNSENGDAHHIRGYILGVSAGMLDEAVFEFETAISLNPNEVKYWINHGYFLIQANRDLPIAVASLERALELEPTNLTAIGNLIDVFNGQLKNSAKTRKYCEMYLGIDPKQASVRRTLSNACLDLGDMDAAEANAREALALVPNESTLHNNLGWVLMRGRKDYQGAKRCFNEAIKLDPNNTQPMYNLVEAANALGDSKGAVQQYEAITDVLEKRLQQNPKSESDNADITWIYREKLKKLDKAKNLYERAILECPTSSRLHDQFGWLLLDFFKDFAKAKPLFERAIELNPRNDEAFNNLGINYERQGDLANAEKNYRIAAELNPNNKYACHNLGSTLIDLDRFAESIPFSKRAVELDPNYVSAVINTGLAFENLEDLDTAETYYRKAAEIDPNYAIAWHNLGNLARLKKRFPEARKLLERAIELDPEYSDAYAKLANVLLVHLKDFDTAEKMIKKAVELKPDNLEYLVDLGFAQIVQGNYDEAEKNADKALAGNGRLNGAYHIKGVIANARDKDFAAAYKYYLKSVEIDPNCFESLVNLGGICLGQMKNPEKAMEFLQRAAKIKPDDPGVIGNLGIAYSEEPYRDIDKAIKLLTESITLDPLNYKALNTLAAIYMEEKEDLKTARRYLERSLSPEVSKYIIEKDIRAAILSNLSLVCIYEDKYAEARKHLEEALSLCPEGGVIHFNYGVLLGATGDSYGCFKECVKGFMLDKNQASRIGQGLSLQQASELFPPTRKIIAHLKDYIRNPHTTPEEKLESYVMLFPILGREDSQEHYPEILELFEKSGMFEALGEAKTGQQTRNLILKHIESPLLNCGWVIKKGRTSANTSRMKEEYTTNSYVAASLVNHKMPLVVSEPMGILKKDEDYYLFIKNGGLSTEGFFYPQDAFVSLKSLAMIHAAATAELDSGEMVCGDERVPLMRFNYLNNIKRRFGARMPRSSQLDDFMAEYERYVISQPAIDSSGFSTHEYFLHGDAYHTNVLRGGVWIDWEPSIDGRLGDVMYDVTHLISYPSLREERPSLVKHYFKTLIDHLDVSGTLQLTQSYGFNMLHNSLCHAGSMRNQKNPEMERAYMSQSLEFMEETPELKRKFERVLETLKAA